MKKAEFRCIDRLRVRWAEVDSQKIVFNGHYLMYFDTAVAAYWRALAMPYHDTMERLRGDIFVRKATVEYHGSARYDDLCEVGVRCARVGTSSMLFVCALFRGETLLVSGELVYVFADPATQTSRPVPPELRALFEAFEDGAPVLDVRVGTWDTLGREAQALRTAVFVDEQQIPAELEWDAADANAVHAVAYNRFGLAVATGRWIDLDDSTAKIGRMAVAQPLRGSGVGGAVLRALMQSARDQGKQRVLLHAQASAVPFYLRAGFSNEGAPFEEAGIAHQAMVQRL
ncbi:YbgC/FadM family acyl-CoA thioesterase [Rubrivivax sp. RP6-9]|uniref:YbgC/FadM family acyl-CoA thioesterase n=1 Tax=Rubrivivax sp. RP6-9 TaxID=3415750 RepID=UPI003CC553C8